MARWFLIKGITIITFVRVKHIVRLQADKGYTLLYLLGRQRPIVLSGNIKQYLDELKRKGRFARIHKKHAVNTDFAHRLAKKRDRLWLLCATQLPITPKGVEALLVHYLR